LLLRCFFMEPCKFLTTGIPLMLSSPCLLRARFTHLIGDEAALKSVWHSKGAGGLRPCILCRNVMKIGSDLVAGQDYLIEATCGDTARFDLARDEHIWAAFDLLKASHSTMSKVAFETLEKATGFAYDPDSLLADEQLRTYVKPASSMTMDWMHNFLQSGTASVEIHAFLSQCRSELGVTFENIAALARADWSWPKAQKNHKLRDIFTPRREQSCQDSFKASASETLLAYPLLRYFAETIVLPTSKLDKECDSFLAMCGLLDVLLSAKKGKINTGALDAKLSRHLAAHKLAYGDQFLKPKHHFAFHNALQLTRDHFMLDCFVHERKHQVLKHAGSLIKNTRVFERLVSSRALLEQCRQLQSLVVEDGLVGKAAECDVVARSLGVPIASIAKCLQCKGHTHAVGDLVLVDDQAAYVRSCVSTKNALFLLVQMLQRTEQISPSSSKWRRLDGLCALDLSAGFDISTAHCWSEDVHGTTLVLHPCL